MTSFLGMYASNHVLKLIPTALLAVGIAAPALAYQYLDIPELIVEYLKILDGINPEASRNYLVTAWGLKALEEPVVSGVNEVTERMINDGEVKNLSGHIEKVYDVSIEALAVVRQLNTDLPKTPNYGHLSKVTASAFEGHCKEGEANRDKMDRLGKSIADLGELNKVAKSYLRVLPAMEQLSKVLGDFWNKYSSLAAYHSAATELTSYGLAVDQWRYWTESGGRCDTVAFPCASQYVSEGWENWREIDRLTAIKKAELIKILDTYQAWYQHWYAESSDACERGEIPNANALREDTVLREHEDKNSIDSGDQLDFKLEIQNLKNELGVSATAGNIDNIDWRMEAKESALAVAEWERREEERRAHAAEQRARLAAVEEQRKIAQQQQQLALAAEARARQQSQAIYRQSSKNTAELETQTFQSSSSSNGQYVPSSIFGAVVQGILQGSLQQQQSGSRPNEPSQAQKEDPWFNSIKNEKDGAVSPPVTCEQAGFVHCKSDASPTGN